MNEIVKFLIEFLVAFVIVFVIYYFILIRQHKKLKDNKVPTEVKLILKYHKINLDKINYKLMLILLSVITSFIMALNLTVIYKFTNSNVVVVIVTVLISLPIALVFYDFIGKYFEKQSKLKQK